MAAGDRLVLSDDVELGGLMRARLEQLGGRAWLPAGGVVSGNNGR